MKKQVYFIFFIFIGLIACNETPSCPITYNIDYNNSYTIGGNWKLLGFYKEGSNSIDYPPCEGYEKNTQYELHLGLGDSLLTVDSIYIYPYEWGAYSGVNWGGGRYNRDSINNIDFDGGGGLWTEVAVWSGKMMDYEKKFQTALHQAYRYELQNNILHIFYSSEDRMIFVAD